MATAQDLYEAAKAQAEGEVAAAQAKVHRLQQHLDGAHQGLVEAEARLAALEKSGPSPFEDAAATVVDEAEGVGASGAGAAHNPTVKTKNNTG